MEVWPLSSLYVWSRIKFISSWIIKCNKQEGDMNAMCNLWQIEQDADIAKIAFIIRLVKLTPSQFTVYDVMKLYSRQETASYHVLYWTMYCLRILEEHHLSHPSSTIKSDIISLWSTVACGSLHILIIQYACEFALELINTLMAHWWWVGYCINGRFINLNYLVKL